ncbi:MAG: hypothetical protein U0T75_11925 [Chitinophagales bacterium]
MDKITPEQFVFETPLYDIIKWKEDDDTVIRDIICFNGKLDGPCIFCGKDTTYHRKGNSPARYEVSQTLRLPMTLGLTLTCGRDDKHEIEIIYKTLPSEFAFLKIGQFPSIASLTKGEINKYRKILGDHFAEFSRGVGLISHGIGIGAFVYLRRVFEKLIEQAHIAAKKGASWNEEKYAKGRMDEKIEMLKSFLPGFLVKNKSLYGILSKGIHELSEQECLDIFPVVKLGIELILDEKIKNKEQEDKIKQGEQLIGKVTTQLKGNDKK